MSNKDKDNKNRPRIAGFNVPSIHRGRPENPHPWRASPNKWNDPDIPVADIQGTGQGVYKAYPEGKK